LSTQPGKRKKRFLAPQEKFEIWMQLVRGETTVAEASDRAGVDRSTIAKLREVARQGALDALAQSRPGRREKQRDFELEAAQAEVERLRTALAEMAVRLTLAEGKEPWD
jgi:transposase-like protein